MTEIIQESVENIREVNLIWYKKLVIRIKKILLSICRFFISVLKILTLFFAIAMSKEFGQGLKDTIRASETEYNISYRIYAVLISILKVFVMLFVIIPFIFYKFICMVISNKKHKK